MKTQNNQVMNVFRQIFILTALIWCLSATSVYAQRWVPRGTLPADAVIGEAEDGRNLYVCRARYEGGLHPGKVVSGRCNIGWGGREIALPAYEVLAGGRGAWGPPQADMAGAFVGGAESDRPLYICRARFGRGTHPGKAFGGNCLIGWGGRENALTAYEVFYVDQGNSLSVTLVTGESDLRGGNSAYITVTLVDGVVLPEKVLSNGQGGGSTETKIVNYSRPISASQIKSFRIRHDGSPRPGNPFDTYDNWDLKTLRIELNGRAVYHSANDSSVGASVTRFTGELRQIDLPVRSTGNEPDFVIADIVRISDRLSVIVSNIGLQTGKVTNVTCSGTGRVITSSANLELNPGSSVPVTVSYVPGGTVTCAVTGVDLSGRPETVTAKG